MSRPLVALVLCLGGCGASYEPGSFTDHGRVEEPRARALGCVDVRVQPRGAGVMPSRYLAIDYEIGNRCTRPVEVALGEAQVIVDLDASRFVTALFDPRDEVTVAVLDGHSFAREALAYETPSSGALNRVCVDVSRLVVERTAERAEPICFVHDGEQLNVEVMR